MLLNRSPISTIATAAALALTVAGTAAFDESKYPDWGGQWQGRAAFPNVAFQWDQTKPPGLGQQARPSRYRHAAGCRSVPACAVP
jgi:hypothetical protein